MFNQIKTVLLLGLLSGLMLLVGTFFGGNAGLTIALVLALLMNFGAYFFSDKMVLAMYVAKEASKKEYAQLHNLVEEVSEKANIPKPRVYIISTQTPNAFATGRDPQHAVVACTRGILKLLTKKELRGVIANEIAHFKNGDILNMSYLMGN